MKKHDPAVYDFERPPLLFRLEDRLKALIGGPLFYAPFYRAMGGLAGHEKVLDFGCGSGAGAKVLARLLLRGGSVTGTDVSGRATRMAGRLLRRFPNARVLHGDIRELGLEPDSFDVASAVHVIHDIVEPKRAGTVRALARALKPGGRLWLLEPTRPSHGMSASEIRDLMRGAGLHEQSAEVTERAFRGVFAKPA